MLWAAACTGFFGFLRTGEFTVPSAKNYDNEVHLNLSDLTLDNRSSPQLVGIKIKQSKTDPFRKGTTIFLGRSGKAICPVEAITSYLAVRSPQPGPLFMFKSGSPLSRTALVKHLQEALQQAGLNPAP